MIAPSNPAEAIILRCPFCNCKIIPLAPHLNLISPTWIYSSPNHTLAHLLPQLHRVLRKNPNSHFLALVLCVGRAAYEVQFAANYFSIFNVSYLVTLIIRLFCSISDKKQ